MLLGQDLGAMTNPMFKGKGPSMNKSSYPPAFPLKHQQKDMRLALALGDENAVSMPVAAAANEVSYSKTPRILLIVGPGIINLFVLNMYLLFYFEQAFKKARSMGLGDLDFSAVIEAVKFSRE